MKLRTDRLFLGRAAYRRRRMIDATRILPVVFAVLVLLPMIWLPHRFSFATGALWLGGGWFVTILLTAALHHGIDGATEDEDDT